MQTGRNYQPYRARMTDQNDVTIVVRRPVIFIMLTKIPGYSAAPVGLDKAYEEYLAQLLYYGNDLFFSGHVSLPFLSFLIFWRYRGFRFYLFLATLVSAAGVLLSKSHYSIDVFAAPFITFTIFEISKFIFKRDFQYTKTVRLEDGV